MRLRSRVCKHRDALWANHFEWYCYDCGFMHYDGDLILSINAHKMGDLLHGEDHSGT